ncbi:MAG TPA: hypothetical protein VFV50_15945 [Bdellovibrionales bacterium]|nr:hypothetical protein [Bdellovibrionales bacterium]
MKRLLPLVALSLLAVGCDDLDGVISVRSSLKLKTKKETITLTQGSHSAKIDVDQGDREIEIKVKNAQGKTREAKVKIPAGMVIPSYSGSFAIASTQSGQDFDMRGEIDTDVDVGPSQYGTQTCTYYDREQVRYEYWETLPDGRKVRRTGWRWETVTRYGDQEIRYHNKHTTVTGKAEFKSPGGAELLATFSGSRSWSETINEYTGPCRRRFGHGGWDHDDGWRRRW